MTTPLPLTKCARCNGLDDLVVGDGPVIVCNGCIDLVGDLISDPLAPCHERLLGTLLEMHANAVRLARTATPPHDLVWEWVA